MNPITIVLADDHALIRAGIRALLENLPDVQVVGEAGSGEEVMVLVEKTHPTLVLMDITMPGINGIESTRRLLQQYPDTKVIILSMHLEHQYALRALQAGAKGYLLKGARAPELELAISSVARGDTYLSPAVSSLIVEKVVSGSTEPSPLEQLTPRQREILRLIAEGMTSKEIALKLGVSVKTVKTHRSDMMSQLGIHDIAGLVRFAVQVGLVSVESGTPPRIKVGGDSEIN